jgi:aromatic ring-opening dioxygenase LigB subunit
MFEFQLLKMLNFSLQLGGKFVEMIQIILITGAMMFQIQALCWFGTELTKEVNNTYKRINIENNYRVKHTHTHTHTHTRARVFVKFCRTR